MKLGRLITCVGLVTLGVAAWTDGGDAKTITFRSDIRLAADKDAEKVSPVSHATTIEWLLGVQRPADLPPIKPSSYDSARAKPFETTLWTVEGSVRKVRQVDGGLELTVQSEKGKSIPVLAYPAGEKTGKFGKVITFTFDTVKRKFSATLPTETLDIPVRVTGFGFFDKGTGDDGKPQTGVRLAPIVDIEFLDIDR